MDRQRLLRRWGDQLRGVFEVGEVAQAKDRGIMGGGGWGRRPHSRGGLVPL